jgi:hypothetical protein
MEYRAWMMRVSHRPMHQAVQINAVAAQVPA